MHQNYSNDHFPFYLSQQVVSNNSIKVPKLGSKIFMQETNRWWCVTFKTLGGRWTIVKKEMVNLKIPFGEMIIQTIFGTWYLNPLDKITSLL